MLHRYALLVRPTACDFLKPVRQQADLIVVTRRRDNKGCGRRVEYGVGCAHRRFIRCVIVLQAADQACFRTDASIVLEMIDKDWLAWVLMMALVKRVVVPEVQVGLSPVEITFGQGDLLSNLHPVSTRL